MDSPTNFFNLVSQYIFSMRQSNMFINDTHWVIVQLLAKPPFLSDRIDQALAQLADITITRFIEYAQTAPNIDHILLRDINTIRNNFVFTEHLDAQLDAVINKHLTINRNTLLPTPKNRQEAATYLMTTNNPITNYREYTHWVSQCLQFIDEDLQEDFDSLSRSLLMNPSRWHMPRMHNLVFEHILKMYEYIIANLPDDHRPHLVAFITNVIGFIRSISVNSANRSVQLMLDTLHDFVDTLIKTNQIY